MNVDEALKHANDLKNNYSGKPYDPAVIVLADEVRRLREEEESGSGLVCVFCGEGFGYAGRTPDEATLRAAVKHEALCPKNPYLSEIDELKAEVRRLRGALEKIEQSCWNDVQYVRAAAHDALQRAGGEE